MCNMYISYSEANQNYCNFYFLDDVSDFEVDFINFSFALRKIVNLKRQRKKKAQFWVKIFLLVMGWKRLLAPV